MASLTTNKSCTASSFVMPYSPKRAVDGISIGADNSSRWVTNTNKSGAYMMVDLGGIYKLTKWGVTLLGAAGGSWGNPQYNVNTFQILGSIDNLNWKEIVTVRENQSSFLSNTIPGLLARYVKLTIGAYKGNNFYNYNPFTSVASFDVEGLPTSNNAKLSNLAASCGAINPVFAADTTAYTINVANSVASTTITPTAQDYYATITVNDVIVQNGTASKAIPLNIGTNMITIVVKSSDSTKTSTYTITVNRAAPPVAALTNLAISAGTLTPTFASTTTAYAASVANEVSNITVTPTAQDGGTITVNGNPVTSGTPSGPINLNVGTNQINVVVTSSDGSTSKPYTIAVTRAAALTGVSAQIVNGSAITLYPSAFNPNCLLYTGSIDYSDADFNAQSITVTPTADANSVIRYGGAVITSGTAVTVNNLAVGDTDVRLDVAGADGTGLVSYTVRITRNHSTYLKTMTCAPGKLSPANVTKANQAYTIKAGTVPSVTITPTAEDTTAGVTTITLVDGGASYVVASGTPSPAISVPSGGSRSVSLVVSSTSGVPSTTYTITVRRL